VNLDTSFGGPCVGAALASLTAPSPQTVVTPEGIALGDSVPKLLATYGSHARFVKALPVGISPDNGYVVPEGNGYLSFSLDPTQTRITAITGGPNPALNPNNCPG
jgi:hypothetical protein